MEEGEREERRGWGIPLTFLWDFLSLGEGEGEGREKVCGEGGRGTSAQPTRGGRREIEDARTVPPTDRPTSLWLRNEKEEERVPRGKEKRRRKTKRRDFSFFIPG